VKRKYQKYDTEQFKKEIPELKDSRVEIYFDTENERNFQDIVKILEKAGSKRLKTIVAVILKNLYLDNIYKIEGKNITAIKIKSGIVRNQEYRIYCKEIFKDGKKVVMITPYLKKVNRNQDDKRIVDIIDDLKTYSYEF
jgi:NADPH:quinone reductase-like Zn-dependent oxidoreductase